MTHTTAKKSLSPPASTHPNEDTRVRTAGILRAMGQRLPIPVDAARNRAFVCGHCAVEWAGAEADCWNCGGPATTEHSHRKSALNLLLATVSGPGRRRRPRRAAHKPRTSR